MSVGAGAGGTGPSRASAIGGRVAVVVVALVVLAGLVLVGTRPRTVAGFAVVDGRVEQVPVTCGSLLAGGGVEDVGDPTGVEVPQDEGLEEDPGVSCPEDGALWQVGIGIAAVLVVAAAAWTWRSLGGRGGAPGAVVGSIDRAAEHVAETSRTRRAGSGPKAPRRASGRRGKRSS